MSCTHHPQKKTTHAYPTLYNCSIARSINLFFHFQFFIFLILNPIPLQRFSCLFVVIHSRIIFHVSTLQIHATPWPMCSISTKLVKTKSLLYLLHLQFSFHTPTCHHGFRFLLGVITEPPRSSPKPFLRSLLATNATPRSHELCLAQRVLSGRERGVPRSNGGPWRVPKG